MLKLSQKKAAFIFAEISLFIIMMYSMICCIYITGVEPNNAVSATYISGIIRLFLENIICALTITVISGAFLFYNACKKNK